MMGKMKERTLLALEIDRLSKTTGADNMHKLSLAKRKLRRLQHKIFD